MAAKANSSNRRNRGDESGGWVIGGTPQKTFLLEECLERGLRWVIEMDDRSRRFDSTRTVTKNGQSLSNVDTIIRAQLFISSWNFWIINRGARHPPHGFRPLRIEEKKNRGPRGSARPRSIDLPGKAEQKRKNIPGSCVSRRGTTCTEWFSSKFIPFSKPESIRVLKTTRLHAGSVKRDIINPGRNVDSSVLPSRNSYRL